MDLFFNKFYGDGRSYNCCTAATMGERPSGNASCPLSLQESILRAFARNPDVTQQAAQIGIGEAQIDEAKSAPVSARWINRQRGPSRQTDSSGRLDNNVSMA